MADFNAAEYIKNANAKEQTAREGKPVIETPVAAVPAKSGDASGSSQAAEPVEDSGEHARLSRSQRRLMRQLGEAEGRAKALEEMIGKLQGVKPAQQDTAAAATDADPEPKEADFKTWNEYTAALSKWAARQETTKALSKAEEKTKATEELESYRQHVRAMDVKAQEDIKKLSDWDEVSKQATEEGPEFNPDEHPNLMGLIASSDMKAYVLYHFAKHPEDLERMLELSKKPGDQIRQFARLEGRVEKLYGDGVEAKPAAEKSKAAAATPTAAERDARKAKPSEAVAARGGSAPAQEISPVLGDGRTLNPAWKERANMREGRRQ